MSDWSSPETAQATLAYLRKQLDENDEATASLRDIAAAVGIGCNTASRAVRRLIETSVIKVARIGTGRDYPTRYRVLAGRGNTQESAA